MTDRKYHAVAVRFSDATCDTDADSDADDFKHRLGVLLAKAAESPRAVVRITLGTIDAADVFEAMRQAEDDRWFDMALDLKPHDDMAKMRAAVVDAGFGIMQTSGKWSIHDVSEAAKAEDERITKMITDNICMEKQLRDARVLAEIISGMLGDTDVEPCAQSLRPEIARLVAVLEKGPTDAEG